MPNKPQRRSVDLSAYPDLVVIYLGFRAHRLRGFLTLLQLGRGLRQLHVNPPPGLLAHDFMLYGWSHVGFRQYWTDLPSLQAFTRAPPHAVWWAKFSKNAEGGGFWHETYCRRGEIEAIYIDMPKIGRARFAPEREPVGPFMTAAQRLNAEGHRPAKIDV